MMLGSALLTLVLGGIVFAVLSITASREEAYVRSEFGAAYASYAARVPRIWPAPRLYTSPEKAEFQVATLRTNLMDALVFLSMIPLAEFMEFVHKTLEIPTFPIW